MKAQTMANVVPILVVLVQSLLHQDNIGISYVGTSNFRMELVNIYVNSMVMPQFMIIITKALFVLMPVNIVVSIRSKTQLQGEQTL
jgi:hypothetical protein